MLLLERREQSKMPIFPGYIGAVEEPTHCMSTPVPSAGITLIPAVVVALKITNLVLSPAVEIKLVKVEDAGKVTVVEAPVGVKLIEL